MSEDKIALLPDLSDPYDLNPDQVASYDRDGYVLLRELCTLDELAPYGQEIERVTFHEAGELVPMEERDTYSKAFIQIGNLWQKSEVAAKFVLAKRFAKVAADLMGVDGVRLYHDQALFKEPGGGHTPWHQDQFYWPLNGVKTITMWMPLVDLPTEPGGMAFAKASHGEGSFEAIRISDDSDAYFEDLIRDNNLEVVKIGAMKAGDATFHSGWNIHGAPENRTSITRAVMTVIYYEDGGVISEPEYDERKLDMETFFPGQSPGEVAASPLNPLLFSR